MQKNLRLTFIAALILVLQVPTVVMGGQVFSKKRTPMPEGLALEALCKRPVLEATLIALVHSIFYEQGPTDSMEKVFTAIKRVCRELLNLRHTCKTFHTDITPEFIGMILRQIGVDVNAGARWWSPLVSAASEGNANCVRILIAAGADVNAINFLGRSPLNMATFMGLAGSSISHRHAKCARILVNYYKEKQIAIDSCLREPLSELDVDTTGVIWADSEITKKRRQTRRF